MLAINYINNNENLLSLVFSYLNVKDLCQIRPVNKTYNKVSNNFNKYWKEACLNCFSLNNENQSIFKREDLIIREELLPKKDPVNWNNVMKLGFDIKYSWTSQKTVLDQYSGLSCELENLSNEFFSNLREHFSLPKLRKENHILENGFNSIHQLFMMDFIYDEQELFSHNDEIFKNRKFGQNIPVRKDDLPFAYLLEHSYDRLISEFTEESDRAAFLNIRWYNFNEFEKEFEKRKFNPESMFFEESDGVKIPSEIQSKAIFNSFAFNQTGGQINSFQNPNFINQLTKNLGDPKDTCFNQKIIDDISFNRNILNSTKIASHNCLLIILNSIVMSVMFFCRLMLVEILQYSSINQAFFLDSLIKYYKTFCDCSIYFNDMLENLNVIVNYLSEDLSKEYPKNPKFSIYRLMLNIWFKEVLTPLLDTRAEKNLGSCYMKLYKRFLLNEINKIQETNDINLIRGNIMEPPNLFQIRNSNNLFNNDEGKISYNRYEDEMNSLFSNEDDLNNLCPFWDVSKVSINNNCQSNLNSTSHSNSNSVLNSHNNSNNITNPFKSNQKIYWQDDVYSFDFQARYFLENINNILLDQICDEYSTFYLNHTDFPVTSSYMFFEQNILKTTDNIIKGFIGKQNKLNLIRSIKDMEFMGLKLINKTQKNFNAIVSDNILVQTEAEILVQFDEFLIKNSLLDRNSNIFNQIFDINQEDRSHFLFQKLFEYCFKYFEDIQISEFIAILFIKELIRSRNPIYQTIEETLEFQREENERYRIIDKQVKKENTRRNIHLDPVNNPIYRQELFNFNTNIKIENYLEEIIRDEYELELESNDHHNFDLDLVKGDYDLIKNHFDNSNNIEIVNTFQQTFDDPNMHSENYDYEMETINDIDYDLCLRR